MKALLTLALAIVGGLALFAGLNQHAFAHYVEPRLRRQYDSIERMHLARLPFASSDYARHVRYRRWNMIIGGSIFLLFAAASAVALIWNALGR